MAEQVQAGNNGVDLEKELTCSICTDVLYQPLTLLDCLHTFCGSCLKEWFSWQAASASHNRRTAQPYTCPSCRAQVRATQHNAAITSLLDMYLKANPHKGKSEQEKEPMRKHYKPGDHVLPEVVFQEEPDSEDERLLAEVRELSMANVHPDAARRRAERPEWHARRRRQDVPSSRTPHRPEEQGRSLRPSRWATQQAQISESRAREPPTPGHEVEHQRSLHNLLSDSGDDSSDVQAEIMQSIVSDGTLEGIDLDNLTPAQEEELTERIAEAYRRRQRQRDRSRDRRQRHTRTNITSDQPPRNGPPISRPHLLEHAAQDTGRSSRRSTSSTSRRHNRSASRNDGPTPHWEGTRSATDLTDRPRTNEGDRERRRRLSSNTRSTTDPENLSTLAQVSRGRTSSYQDRTSVDTQRPTAAHPQEAVRGQSASTNHRSPSLTLPLPQQQVQTEQTVRPVTSNAAFAPEPVFSAPPTVTSVPQSQLAPDAPSVWCNSCNAQNIQYALHYNCSKCLDGNINLCLACYRGGRGCHHWFGFGYVAYIRCQRDSPPEGWPTGKERPHILTPRRYLRPDAGINTSLAARTQEGAFCERCFSYANDCYWHCQICLEGAWGFCNKCVTQGRHCTHPLMPVAHLSTLRQPHQDATKTLFVPLPHLKEDSYVVLPVRQDCDICHYLIPPSSTRFHCYQCSDGDYDMCQECYRSLVAAGKISQGDGPHGWRRCLQGHRMAIVGFQDSPEGGQQRVVVREPVGGWALREDATSSAFAQASGSQLLPPDGGVGLRCLALWSRFPPEDVTDELTFPKNAEIREAEQMNQDWFWGVYGGGKGLFPANHVRVL